MGKKCSKSDTLMRIRTVQHWLMEDQSWSDIIASGVAMWGVSIRQVERYYSQAFEDFKEAGKWSQEKKKHYYIQRKKKLIREMSGEFRKTPAGVNAINKVLDSMAQLDGVIIQKVELTGKDGLPIQTESKVNIDLSEMTPKQLNALRLFKKSLRSEDDDD